MVDGATGKVKITLFCADKKAAGGNPAAGAKAGLALAALLAPWPSRPAAGLFVPPLLGAAWVLRSHRN